MRTAAARPVESDPPIACDDGGASSAEDALPGGATVTIMLRGQAHRLATEPGETIVQAAYRLGVRPPVSCLSGTCGTCIARLTEGRVEMLSNDVLSADEVAQGYVLTCQALPATRTVAVIYED